LSSCWPIRKRNANERADRGKPKGEGGTKGSTTQVSGYPGEIFYGVSLSIPSSTKRIRLKLAKQRVCEQFSLSLPAVPRRVGEKMCARKKHIWDRPWGALSARASMRNQWRKEIRNQCELGFLILIKNELSVHQGPRTNESITVSTMAPVTHVDSDTKDFRTITSP
jgi:hypothetical protein